MEYPYQIVAFLGEQPEKGQLIYGDENGGWLPQVALKRRFALKDPDDQSSFVERLRDFCATSPAFEIQTGDLEKSDRMPVEVIPIIEPSAATKFHQDFLKRFGQTIVSKYSDREGDNYFPHVTAQYWDKYVIDVDLFQNRTFKLASVWLVKDTPDEKDTTAFEQFSLKASQ